MSYEQDHSHYHCWLQDGEPACGIAKRDHKRCCLCPKKINEEPAHSTERTRLIEAQKQLCDDLSVPMFAPSSGKCFKCSRDCVDGRWAIEHITGCGKCNWSFCD